MGDDRVQYYLVTTVLHIQLLTDKNQWLHLAWAMMVDMEPCHMKKARKKIIYYKHRSKHFSAQQKGSCHVTMSQYSMTRAKQSYLRWTIPKKCLSRHWRSTWSTMETPISSLVTNGMLNMVSLHIGCGIWNFSLTYLPRIKPITAKKQWFQPGKRRPEYLRMLPMGQWNSCSLFSEEINVFSLQNRCKTMFFLFVSMYCIVLYYRGRFNLIEKRRNPHG